MTYLIDAANEQGLETIVTQALEHRNVHGVMVDVHFLWLYAWKLHLRINFSEEISIFDVETIFQSNRPKFLDESINPDEIFQNLSYVDITWRPLHWKDYFKVYFKDKSNLIVKILLLPGTRPIEISYEGPLTILQEYRGVPTLSANSKKFRRPLEGGLSIGDSNITSGTIGGILSDKSGKHYGITCGHVINSNGVQVDQPSQLDSKKASAIGLSVFTQPPFSTANVLCNPYDNSGTIYNKMDLSLIEIDPAINTSKTVLNIGKIQGFVPKNQLHRNLAIEYNGRSSGHKNLILGGIGVMNKVRDLSGNLCCFEHLVELKEPYLSKLFFKRPVKAGDSGAWVVAQGQSGNEWVGMIIGEDRQTGYAIMSEDILTFLSANGYSVNCS